MIKKVYTDKPERPYIFGIDNTKKPTQKKLIKAISKGIGTDLIQETDIPVEFAPVHPNKTPLDLHLDWRKFLLLNIKAKPSTLFVPAEGGGEGDDEGGEGGGGGSLDWVYLKGLAHHIQDVKKEFEKHRGLKPFQTTIIGKPCAGKSFFGAKLADHYNVPHITTDVVLRDIEHWQDEQEKVFNVKEEKRKKAEAIENARLAEEKAKKDEEELKKQQARQARKDARRAADPDNYQSSDGEGAGITSPPPEAKDDDDADEKPAEAPPAGDDEAPAEEGTLSMADRKAKYQKQLELLKIEAQQSDDDFAELPIKVKIRDENKGDKNARVSTQLLCEAFRWRLSQNDCQNRGYILDGFPYSYKDAESVFFVTPEPPKKPEPELDEDGNPKEVEAEPEGEEAIDLKPQFQKTIYPDNVIYIKGNDDYLRKRARELEAKGDKASKWDPENLERRLARFNECNNLQLFVRANTHKDLGLPSYKPGVLPVSRFYQENKTEVFEVECDGDIFEMFESMRVYIERNGRSYNYLKVVKTLNDERETQLEQEEKDFNADKARKAEEDE